MGLKPNKKKQGIAAAAKHKPQEQAKQAARPLQVHDNSDNDQPVLFFMPNGRYGEFCQWFPASFHVSQAQITELIGPPSKDKDDSDSSSNNPHNVITFCCAEQFMMYCKAGRFGDAATQQRVLATSNPKEQKRLGRLTAGFTDAQWDPVKSAVVVAGNVAKFGQNPKLRDKLLATGDRLLAEAASQDRVWGIGYTEEHAMQFRQHWGENRLGKALMAAREQLRREMEQPEERDGEVETEVRETSP